MVLRHESHRSEPMEAGCRLTLRAHHDGVSAMLDGGVHHVFHNECGAVVNMGSVGEVENDDLVALNVSAYGLRQRLGGRSRRSLRLPSGRWGPRSRSVSLRPGRTASPGRWPRTGLGAPNTSPSVPGPRKAGFGWQVVGETGAAVAGPVAAGHADAVGELVLSNDLAHHWTGWTGGTRVHIGLRPPAPKD